MTWNSAPQNAMSLLVALIVTTMGTVLIIAPGTQGITAELVHWVVHALVHSRTRIAVLIRHHRILMAG